MFVDVYVYVYMYVCMLKQICMYLSCICIYVCVHVGIFMNCLIEYIPCVRFKRIWNDKILCRYYDLSVEVIGPSLCRCMFSMYIRICVCNVGVCMYVCIYVYLGMYMYVCMCMYVYVCMYICIYMYVYVCVCMY